MKRGPFDYLIEEGVVVGEKSVETLYLEKGSLIYQPPQRITPIFEIVSGVIKIGSYSPDGEEVCYDILKPGEFFGNLQYLNGQFSEFAKALTSVELKSYEIEFFKHAVTHYPKVSEWFCKEIVRRWCRAEDRLYAVRSLDASEKVKRILPHFQDHISFSTGKSIPLLKLITLQDIADLTGLTRQTVSKVMQLEFADEKKAKEKPKVKRKIA